MQVLTPSGYKSPAALANGDEVCAFDATTGSPIINHVENIDFVDYAEWCRWWQVEATVPPFNWYRINGTHLLFGEQSLWRNGANVCHVRDLVVGDVIHDGSDNDITVTSVEVVEDNALVWYRFDIDGDHSYIVDDLTVHNASRFWVGGTGTWDSSTTTNWAASSGGAGGQSVPGSADSVTFNASSVILNTSATITLNFGGTITILSLDMSNFSRNTSGTAIWDNSVNNNNITVSQANDFFWSGSGTRTIKFGTATYTLTSTTASWNFLTTTNATISGTPNITFTGATNGNKIFNGGSLAIYGTLTLTATSSAANWQILGGNTFASIVVPSPNYVQLGASQTISGTVAIAGTISAIISFLSTGVSSQRNLSVGAGSTFAWCSFRDINLLGSPTSSNCIDLGDNSGMTINAPNTTRSRIQSGF